MTHERHLAKLESRIACVSQTQTLSRDIENRPELYYGLDSGEYMIFDTYLGKTEYVITVVRPRPTQVQLSIRSLCHGIRFPVYAWLEPIGNRIQVRLPSRILKLSQPNGQKNWEIKDWLYCNEILDINSIPLAERDNED